MLSGMSVVALSCLVSRSFVLAPNVWLRPKNKCKEADHARALLKIPESDHLTLLNVYNSWVQSGSHGQFHGFPPENSFPIDSKDPTWAQSHCLCQRSLVQAENVRRQLELLMVRFDIDLVSVDDGPKLYQRVREALVCGYFMQVAHREGGVYVTIEDNRQAFLHPSCGFDTAPEWVLFNEFIITTRPYIRTVTAINPEW